MKEAAAEMSQAAELIRFSLEQWMEQFREQVAVLSMGDTNGN